MKLWTYIRTPKAMCSKGDTHIYIYIYIYIYTVSQNVNKRKVLHNAL